MIDDFTPPAQEPHDPDARIAALEADLAAARNRIALLEREACQCAARRDTLEAAIAEALRCYRAGVFGAMAEALTIDGD